ncbi:glutamine amidotransferase subunit pdxT [Thamnocephalis sphaerospora]|uniref:glutaminase n=1 Tax=Thamnocephalis sphaerospora TaxID=78915 RepID=A0A4P9XP29_9FUNG|nr:glutamine amidotransferase subunit pdxT [Thamnocephalis sphaerospora]|eukprot:RKP07754.1 glutamine amidotransferase subunit pdxT [Thamnocephalis sphaerospora]
MQLTTPAVDTTRTPAEGRPLRIGVLAIQSGFHEHQVMLHRAAANAEVVQVRTKAELEDPALDGLVIPGGESTTMSIVAQRSGAWDALHAFVRKRPVWGTCAGMILLSADALNQKKDGQALLGALPITVRRNRFGSQVDSFQIELQEPVEVLSEGDKGSAGFPALFIRAPVVEKVGEDVKVLTWLPRTSGESSEAVAVRHGDILACAFHPELTGDDRWHRYFVRMVADARRAREAAA